MREHSFIVIVNEQVLGVLLWTSGSWICCFTPIFNC